MILRVFKHFVIVVMCLSLLVVPTSAGWLDSWYQQKISSSPEYVKGQQRGYFTFGSFNAKMPSDTLYPITISKPQLKLGCGGIDLFLGGFGFVNFEYLVQKMQRLIQAAPYVAFQIALKTISQKLGGIIETAEALINALNQLQFNECQILEGFSVKLAETGDITAALQEVANVTGLSNFWKKGMDLATKGKIKDVKAKDLVEGCPSKVQEIFKNITSKGLIDHVAAERGYNNPDFIAMIRAAIGDLYIQYRDDSGVPMISYIEPCGDFFQELLSRQTIKLRRQVGPNVQCEDYNLDNFIGKIRQDVYALYNQMKDKSDNANMRFLNAKKTPLPLYLIVKTATMTNDPTVVEGIIEPVAYGYLMHAMSEMVSVAEADVQRVFKIMAEAKKQMETEPQTTDKTKVCHLPEIQFRLSERMVENHTKAMHSMNSVFLSSLKQVDTLINIVSKYQNFYDTASKQIALRFGVFPAERVMGK